MNIFNFHNLTSFPSHTVSLLQEKVMLSLSSQHKRILLIASCALGFLAACYAISRCFGEKKATSLAKISFDDEDKSDLTDDIKESSPSKKKEALKPKKTETVRKIIYEGKILNGRPYGQGKLTFPNGKVIEGEFKNGMLNGKGKIVHSDGEKLDGEFKNGSFVEGKVTFPNGKEIEGVFKNGLLNGKGKIVCSDGETWDGEFKNGWLIEGKVNFPDGLIEQGTFLREVLHGQGKVTKPNGDVQEGEFHFGVHCYGISTQQLDNGETVTCEKIKPLSKKNVQPNKPLIEDDDVEEDDSDEVKEKLPADYLID